MCKSRVACEVGMSSHKSNCMGELSCHAKSSLKGELSCHAKSSLKGEVSCHAKTSYKSSYNSS
jgi:hypothetical protein